MKRNFAAGLLVVCLVLVLAGCSRSPQVTFYTLGSGVPRDNSAATGAVPVIAVGPVTLPELVDRPQLVLRVSANRVEILETHRWAESLKGEISRLIAENLGGMLGSSRVAASFQQSGPDAEYRVAVDIKRFEATPGDAVTVEAFWSMRRSPGGVPVTGQLLLREPVGAEGYDSMVAAYGRAILAISSDIAKAVRSETAKKK